MKPTRTLNTMNWKFIALGFFASTLSFTSCTPERSGATGWAYNETSNGGFERRPYLGQETAPGLVFIEGGTFTMGQVEDDDFELGQHPAPCYRAIVLHGRG